MNINLVPVINSKVRYLQASKAKVILKILIVLMIISGGLLRYEAKKANDWQTVRDFTDSTFGNILGTIHKMVDNFALYWQALRQDAEKIEQLYKDSSELQFWQAQFNTAQKELNELKAQLKMPMAADWQVIHANIINHSKYTLNRNFLINKGQNQGVYVNDPVINKNGLIGRVVQVTDNHARIMLLSDPESRIPVVSSQGIRGIISGNNTNLVNLVLQDNFGELQENEEIYTADSGKIFPRGILVGKVAPKQNIVGNNGQIALNFIPGELSVVTIIHSRALEKERS